MSLTGRTRLAGVLGWPVAHSLSPRLHNRWIAEAGLDAAYLPLPVAPENFAQAVRSLRDLGFAGANVTLPHKEAAKALADSLSPAAERIGAVNTLVFRDGTIHGDNTDGAGFLANLTQWWPEWRPGPCALLGAGGAARAIAVALLDAGCPDLTIANRSQVRAEELAAELARWSSAEITVLPWEARADRLEAITLLVNTTSLGMQGKPALDMDLSGLPATAGVADIVYTPLETPLLGAAQRRGLRAIEGLGMLLHQAVPGFEAWFGHRPQVDMATRRYVEEALAS